MRLGFIMTSLIGCFIWIIIYGGSGSMALASWLRSQVHRQGFLTSGTLILGPVMFYSQNTLALILILAPSPRPSLVYFQSLKGQETSFPLPQSGQYWRAHQEIFELLECPIKFFTPTKILLLLRTLKKRKHYNIFRLRQHLFFATCEKCCL